MTEPTTLEKLRDHILYEGGEWDVARARTYLETQGLYFTPGKTYFALRALEAEGHLVKKDGIVVASVWVVASETDVHTSHCCSKHGCKYGSDECSVVRFGFTQEFLCERCDDEEASFPAWSDELADEIWTVFHAALYDSKRGMHLDGRKPLGFKAIYDLLKRKAQE